MTAAQVKPEHITPHTKANRLVRGRSATSLKNSPDTPKFAEQLLNGIDGDNSVDGINPDDGKVNGWKASYRLEARAARYYAKCIGRYDDLQCADEGAAIQKETARILALKGGYEEGWFIGTGLTRLEHSD